MSSEKPGQKEAKIAPVDTQSTAAGNPNDGAPDWLSAPAHTLDADVAIKTFKTDPRMGLDEAQVREYQGIFGPNKLKETPPISFWSILLRNALNGEWACLPCNLCPVCVWVSPAVALAAPPFMREFRRTRSPSSGPWLS